MEFYIVKEVDRPYAKNVCQRMNKNGGLEYISDSFRTWHVKNGRMRINEESTNLESFGFNITVKSGNVYFDKVRQSTAKYQDGKHREWQGDHIFSLKIKR